MRVYLRDQNEILGTLRRIMRDTTVTPRWTDGEYVDAINSSLSEWHGRVSYPCYYDLGTIGSNPYYTLPYYVRDAVTPQFLEYAYAGDNSVVDESGDEIWKNIPVFDIDYSTDGNVSVELSGCFNTSGRVVYWTSNGPVPRGANTVYAGDWASDATSLRVAMATTGQSIPDVGHIHVNSEWIFYAGVTPQTDGYTLLNCKRARNGTTAAAHTADDTVYWGVAADDQRLWGQLENQVRYKLHTMFLTDGAPHEVELHTWLRRDGKEEVANFWKTYAPRRPLRRHLTSESRFAMRLYR